MPKPLYGAFERLDVSARAGALGGAFVALGNSSFGGFYNPASLELLPSREVGVFYSQPYGMSELSYFAFSFADPGFLPNSLGSLGLSVKRYGFELYNEKTVAASYAGAFERVFFYGFSLNYHHLSIKNYGSAAAFGLSLGTLFLVSPEFSLGFSGFNLNRPTIGKTSEALPQSYILGMAYRPDGNLRILIDFEKDPRFALMLKSGVEYEPVEAISLRAGFSTEPKKMSGGIGIHYGAMDIDYALAAHSDLGLTHQVALMVHFGAPENEPVFQAKLLAFETAWYRSESLKSGEVIDLNRASASDLLRVPGMSRRAAFNILRYREAYGAFLTISELENVRGISPGMYEKIKDYLIIGEHE
ncbi:Helix-hairpin-helix DNA-binding class 1 [Chloroherpeton thalassium ATCC 35110]|uniref:Helix-hairpin-helix DNA-binding class 1 n=1 Tax=Chloroherpeton thalassium (strain ATCC 35110 / GB-78) TaxID=517418 RepID=B3QV23_CHLT3|nr:helix-hairpin-helix domain-containing protein [Chloroherpeton thalassium]ACF12977.1 Helix-hairpin-helix DNA-binding class 1 [Chloroherpeton thalassium ATCC 35110]